MERPYLMAHRCPQCGNKDAHREWAGARMWSSSWGHSFSCCSDACGEAFATKHKELAATRKGRKELARLWNELEGESDWRLSGEPYYGYDAEKLLRGRHG